MSGDGTPSPRLLKVLRYLGLAEDPGTRRPGASRFWTGRDVSQHLDRELDELRRRIAALEDRRD